MLASQPKQRGEMGFTEFNPEIENETDALDGTPAWHLEGVNCEKLPAVLRASAWIYYSQYGNDGWGLVCLAIVGGFACPFDAQPTKA